MSLAGTVDAPLEMFGGLVSDMAAAELPAGVSPDCADVIFSDSSVRTRPGLQSVFAAFAGNPTVNYLKTYITLNQTLRLLLMDSTGALYKESSPGVLSSVATGLAANSYANSATLFGREYMAVSDGKIGNDLPRQFDDANFDRVSQVGPGAGVFAAADIFASISTITRAANVVTVVTATSHNLQTGDQVVIAGVTGGATSFNGTFPLASIVNATQFTYNQTGANESGNPGTGTANPLGAIAVGAHQVVVIFKTRQGYLTRPSPALAWTAAGARKVIVTGIPTGPANVAARILAFTGAAGAAFFYTSAMMIPDNTTTFLIADFSEAALLAATNADHLFKLVELGACAGVMDYAQRLFWWGERAKQTNWLNLTFDGGFSGNVPNGFTADATFGAGGSKETSQVVWGEAYRIAGDGATATRGLITEPAVKDAAGVALIAPHTDYSVRARVLRSAGLTQGTLKIHLFSQTGGINTPGLQVTATAAGASFAEFTAVLAAPLATIPSDLVLRVLAEGAPTNAQYFIVDNIEIFSTAQPALASLVRASRPADPESYDGVNGILSVAENNGQGIRSAFRLREHLYFVKEHSLYVTRDDGSNEPALWPLEEVSRRVGTPAVRGVGFGEDWVVIAHRSGLYIFSGGEPVKISQEIQPLWDQINWQYGHTLWVTVDTRERRIFVGAPIGAATAPNRVLVLDYRDLDSAEQIAARPPIHTTFAGRKHAADKARKWAPWLVSAASCAMVERADGTAQAFFGNGAGNGKVYQLSAAQLSDDGAAIASYYTTHFLPQTELEQQLGLRAHRKLFSYLTLFVEGAGTLSLTAYVNSSASSFVQASLALANPATKDLELPLNLLGERVAFRLSTNVAGSWFRLQKFAPVVQPDPWSPLRGSN